ncbi:hypothetical protein A3734_06475 [Sulfitobacter sp. HI0054]|uniref:hypothetical protein n=1 Tax=Sulfitobacter sp. HI0054 TaxID=1822238 RepID=UPI0007C356F1|nr:hypothetical protein [Sulfitobacter sp. HI0054]KZY51001.1 hypothetical protein A3734_06475 [Sulfitobacter sp. HI0054]
MTLHQPIVHHIPRACDPVLTAAQLAGNGNRKIVSARLLEALSLHEGDSDLGQWAEAALRAGDFYLRSNREDYETSAHECENVTGYAERLADEWRLEAESMAEVMQ